jgi:alpha-galactosidase
MTIAATGYGQTRFASWNATQLKLSNGVVERTIHLPSDTGNYFTTAYKPVQGDFKYFTSGNTEFQFELNNVSYSGKSKWRLVDIKDAKDLYQGEGANVTLLSEDKRTELTIQYLLYPDLPVIRKSLTIKNLASTAVSLESVDVERFTTTGYWASTFSWIFSDYGRRRSIGPFEGGMQDALVIVHNPDWQQGIVVGNEASGVLKRTTAFWNSAEITSGLTHSDARFPFRKWINPGETFTTPAVFTMVYNGQKTMSNVLNEAVPDFIRKHMGIRLSVLKEKPTFVYNTWHPFAANINEKLVMELAKAAADAGMKEFVIDDGWQDNYGDWGIDKTKFPRGLKPVFDYIKSLGMKPGLWVSVGSASSVSKVYHDHPEWFARDMKGNFANLQLEGESADISSACFSTGWKDHIKKILLKLSVDYGLEYLKLDFAVVSSAYVFAPEKSGCYATNHPAHKDHHESFYVNYERMWQLFDELHAAKPGLFIDCTFEAMGGLQLIDYAMLKHAEGNWLSNYEQPNENEDLRVRNIAWWRSPAMPATALVIGNPRMDDAGWEMHIKSLAGALPIMLGDPRKLPPEKFALYRSYADWLQRMEHAHNIMMFRQDLDGFDEPAEGFWDGFQRINTDTKSGGIVGIFRHGAVENERTLRVRYLAPDKSYTVREALTGKMITTATGKQLSTSGLRIKIDETYDGKLFEILEVDKKVK